MIHTTVQLLRAVAIDVALNSSDNALITLLISTNFVELRREVFKKYGRDNIFQVTCADCVERFQLFVFCLCIVLKNAHATSINEVELFWIYFVFVAEIIVDCTKHAFITKFNKVDGTLYSKFKGRICEDLTNSRHFDVSYGWWWLVAGTGLQRCLHWTNNDPNNIFDETAR